MDLKGGYVIPAFLNGHCHLGDTGAKELGIGLAVEAAVVPPNGLKHQYLRSINKEQQTATIRHGLSEMLRNGIAVCADFREGARRAFWLCARHRRACPSLLWRCAVPWRTARRIPT
jgi:cytosine/adenosine deaminase-related metal-dependent hydrolase